VDVITAAIGFDEQRVFGEVCQESKFDLRIVRGQQNMNGFSRKCGTNFAAEFGANRNVLQVRICLRQSSGRRSGLT
jgi:hypothetical protein